MKLNRNLTVAGFLSALFLGQAVLAAMPVGGFSKRTDQLADLSPKTSQNSAIEDTVRQFTSGLLREKFQEGDLLHQILAQRYFRPYEEVISNLHEQVEAETDLIYFVNTSANKNQCNDLGSIKFQNQHMLMIKRVDDNKPMFQRNAQGQIIGLNPRGIQIVGLKRDQSVGGIDYKTAPQFLAPEQFDSGISPLIPVSTGIPGGSKILTFSGIFRVNEERTNSRTKNEEVVSGQDPMQFSVYINGEYTSDNRESGLAIHGTPQNNWAMLGKQRASSGCIRTHTEFSRWNRAQLFNYRNQNRNSLDPKPELSGSIRLWSRRDHFPPPAEAFPSLPLSNDAKLKVLIVFFDGYSGSCS
ncbi:MAG: L,D-transpeptidase [Pseudobdellovibrionaceae bacterium]